MAELISTGIPGLDDILKGGIRKTSSVLVTGAPGTGKSIMGLQFIYSGAQKNEPGLYITAEERVPSLREYSKSLGIDFEKYEKTKMIVLLEQKITGGKVVSFQVPMDIIKKNKIQRVVLDSLSFFRYVYSETPLDFRRGILDFINEMKNAGITLLVTSEKQTTEIDSFVYEPPDFLFEGLILLLKIRKGSSFERCLSVAKMRGQDHLLEIFPFKISKGGVKVLSSQIPFSLIEKDMSKRF